MREQGGSQVPDAQAALTPGLQKTLNGQAVNLWEWDAAELRARTRPPLTVMEALHTPEATVFEQEGVSLDAFRKFMSDNALALIVSRNVTRRDTFDREQPFNLRVRRAGGVQSTAVGAGAGAKLWDVDHLQLFQAQQLRGIRNDTTRGRRVLAQPLKPVRVAGKDVNLPADNSAPVGAVPVAADGSVAALVPADRATTWQLVDSATPGDARLGTDGIVRERFWLSFRPGEVRVCATCHGVSAKDQTGALGAAVQNPPDALRQLLRHYKSQFAPLGVR